MRKILLLLLLIPGFASLVRPDDAVSSLARSDTAVDNIANVEFRLDERVFDVMCAAHAAGYDYGLSQEPDGTLRRRVLREVQATPLPVGLQDALRDFYRLRNVEMDAFSQQSKYAGFALLLDAPPEFTLRLGGREPPPAVKALIGFEQYLSAYYRDAQLAAVWARHRPEVLDQLRSMRAAMKDSVLAVLAYGRMPARLYLNRRLIVIPDAINAPGIINAVQLEGNYYILASPTDHWERYQRFFIHEYLHYLLDPVLDPLAPRFDQEAAMRRLMAGQRRRSDLIDQPFRAVKESLINAAELAVLGQLGVDVRRDRQEMIDRDSPFLPFFEAWLAECHQGDKPLADYVAEQLPRVEIPSLCAAAVAPAGRGPEAASAAKPAPAPEPVAPDPAAVRTAALEQAGQLIQAGRIDEAESALAPILAASPTDPIARFTLAQAKFARKDYTAALDAYDQVLGAAGLPVWVRGWSLVRSGYCLLRLGREEEARERFTEATRGSGDDRGAAAAATRALGQMGQDSATEK